jgi:hypothetical protein
MNPPRVAIALLLVAGACLAAGTPVVIVWVKPSMAVYLSHPAVILPAFVPYGLCAAIWLRRGANRRASAVVSGLLFAGTVAAHGPILWSPSTFGGDMVALFFIGWALAATAGVLLGSAGAWIVLRVRGSREA